MKKEEILKEMKDLVANAEAEERALTEEEVQKYSDLESKVKTSMDLATKKAAITKQESEIASFNAEQDSVEKYDRVLPSTPSIEVNNTKSEDRKQVESYAFCKQLMGVKLTDDESTVASYQIDVANDGNVIPTLLQNKIEKKLIEDSRIYDLIRKSNVNAPFNVFEETTAQVSPNERTSDVAAPGSETDSALSPISFTPKYLYNQVVMSIALASQASVDVESHFVNSVVDGYRRKLEAAIISGSGSSGQVLGLDALSTIAGQSVATVEQGTTNTLTLAHMIELYKTLSINMADSASRPAFLMSPTSYWKLVEDIRMDARSDIGTPADQAIVLSNSGLLMDYRNGGELQFMGAPVIKTNALAELSADNAVSALLVDLDKVQLNVFQGGAIKEVSDVTHFQKGLKVFGMHSVIDSQVIHSGGLVQFHNEDTS